MNDVSGGRIWTSGPLLSYVTFSHPSSLCTRLCKVLGAKVECSVLMLWSVLCIQVSKEESDSREYKSELEKGGKGMHQEAVAGINETKQQVL